MNIFKRFYGWLKNDWEVTQQTTGQWNISVSTDLFGNSKETKYCWFYIEYSKYLNQYKLRLEGYKPMEHKLYDIYREELIKLKKTL